MGRHAVIDRCLKRPTEWWRMYFYKTLDREYVCFEDRYTVRYREQRCRNKGTKWKICKRYASDPQPCSYHKSMSATILTARSTDRKASLRDFHKTSEFDFSPTGFAEHVARGNRHTRLAVLIPCLWFMYRDTYCIESSLALILTLTAYSVFLFHIYTREISTFVVTIVRVQIIFDVLSYL